MPVQRVAACGNVLSGPVAQIRGGIHRHKREVSRTDRSSLQANSRGRDVASVAQPHVIADEGLPRKAQVDSAGDACAVCLACELSLCAALRTCASDANRQATGALPISTVHTVPARRTIFHPKEWSEFVPVICSGWSVSSIALPDGRRQILSFLLPGDAVSMAFLFGPLSGRHVEAVTEVTYRKFKRSDLRALLLDLENLDRGAGSGRSACARPRPPDRERANCPANPESGGASCQARHDVRPDDGVSPAPATYRGRRGFDARPCEQGIGRVSAGSLDRNQQPFADDHQ
jgi:Cyclic nucleotide-binding domain